MSHSSCGLTRYNSYMTIQFMCHGRDLGSARQLLHAKPCLWGGSLEQIQCQRECWLLQMAQQRTLVLFLRDLTYCLGSDPRADACAAPCAGRA